MRASGRIRLLLSVFPSSWRDQHEEELLWMLQQERRGASLLTPATVADLVGHGVEIRTAHLLRRLPLLLRARTSAAATVTLMLLAGVLLAAVELRQPTSTSVALVGWVMAGVGVLTGRPGIGRLLSLLATAYVLITALVLHGDAAAARAPLFVLLPIGLLGVLAGAETPRLSRPDRLGLLRVALLIACGMALAVLPLAALGFLDAAPPGYRHPVPWASLHTVVIVVAMVVAGALLARRRPGWLLPLAMSVTPLLAIFDPAQDLLVRASPALVVITTVLLVAGGCAIVTREISGAGRTTGAGAGGRRVLR